MNKEKTHISNDNKLGTGMTFSWKIRELKKIEFIKNNDIPTIIFDLKEEFLNLEENLGVYIGCEYDKKPIKFIKYESLSLGGE